METWDLGEEALGRLRSEISSSLHASPDEIRMISLDGHKAIPDATHKIRVHDASDVPIAFLLLSSPNGPGIVARGATAARAAREALGTELGRVVAIPLADGEVDGRSYALMPMLEPISTRKPLWFLRRRRLQPRLLEWLGRSAEVTRAPVAANELGGVRRPLEALTALQGLPDGPRRSASAALTDLERERWRPVHTLMHGDLWIGNVLIDGRLQSRPWPERFVVTDWPGSLVRGYAFFDLVRLARSLSLPRPLLQRELAHHAARLGCGVGEAQYHVLCALGTIAENLEHFPLARFAEMAESCLAALHEPPRSG